MITMMNPTMVENENMGFWDRVRELCRVNAISLAELARRTELSYGNMTRQITQNKIPVKYDQIQKMAQELGTTPEYLLSGTNAEANRRSPELEELLDNFISLSEDQQKYIKGIIENIADLNNEIGRMHQELDMMLHPEDYPIK